MSASPEPHSTERRAVALVCCVWGAAFTDFFCRYALATLLTEDNLPGVARDVDVSLLLYTTAEDFAAIERDPHFLAFKEHASVRYIGTESFPSEIYRNHWTFWQHAIAEFKDVFFAFVFFLIPDCIFASDSLTRILASLENHEIIYYTVPQICRELVIAELEEMRGARGNTTPSLSIPRAKLLELFLKYISPKHAVAVHHPDFFVTHPEYLIHVEPCRLGIIELASHPLALRSASGGVTRVFNPASPQRDLAFLEVLALGCELTLKFIEQFYRWPALAAHPSRNVSLASWCFTFREHGIPAYAETQAEITVHGRANILDRRMPVRSLRVRYSNIAMRFIETQYRLYEFAATKSSHEVCRCIALAMCLPGMRRRIAALGQSVTIFLPSSGNIRDMLQAIQRTGNASAYREFCLMHIVAGHLRLKHGEVFRLAPSRRCGIIRSHVQSIDPRVPNPRQSTATVKVLSYPHLIEEGVVVYDVDLDYGDTMNMLHRLSRLSNSQSMEAAVDVFR